MKTLILSLLIITLCLNAHAADWNTSGTVRTSGGELHYRVSGTGKPLLLLHGYSGYGEQWRGFLDEFVDNYKVIAVDLPGHGQSSKLRSSFIIADAARDMWQLMDHLGVKQIHGVGYSAGGMTLLQMALQEPSRVQSMVLAASAFTVLEDRSGEPFELLPEAYRQDLLRNHNGDMEKIRSMLSAKYVSDMKLPELRGLQTPTLLVAGDRDESFPLPVVVETYLTLPQAKLWIVPGVGHALFWPWGGSERLAKQFPAEVSRFFREVQ
ncbi:MAG: alpha/beta hydrolase [Gammaproteobacteria bacterium]|jgi:pimeloyl-ACP methyl ester carboxylesterase|nr:alpha/beta hydrolase [Gammaproteobacteria bacterium]